MAQFNYTVDTRPMAESVNRVSGQLNTTTAAVTAMEAAVIKSEKDAADNICTNVDRGFYNLINSQISAKLATHFTDMNVKVSLSLEYAKALSAMKPRMEADFNRLRRDYLKIFKNLDRALEERIKQLDKDAMRFADIRMQIITHRMAKEAAGVVSGTKELGTVGQKAISARIKKKASKAISNLGSRISDNIEYGSNMESILESVNATVSQSEFIPIIIAQEKSMVIEDSNVTQVVCPGQVSDTVKNKVNMAVMEQLQNIVDTEKTSEEKDLITQEFNAMVAAANLETRVTQTMTNLFLKGGIR